MGLYAPFFSEVFMLEPTADYFKRIITAVNLDNTWNDDDDWWTSYDDEKYGIVDVNVYNCCYDEIDEDEVSISVYKTLDRGNDYRETDYSESIVKFTIKKELLFK